MIHYLYSKKTYLLLIAFLLAYPFISSAQVAQNSGVCFQGQPNEFNYTCDRCSADVTAYGSRETSLPCFEFSGNTQNTCQRWCFFNNEHVAGRDNNGAVCVDYLSWDCQYNGVVGICSYDIDHSSAPLFGRDGGEYWCNTDPGNNTPDFTVVADPGTASITQGGSQVYQITMTSVYSYSGSLTLTAPCPQGATCSWDGGSSTVVLPADDVALKYYTVSNTTNTPPGTYNIPFNVTDGSTSHTATVSLTVNAVACTPASLQDGGVSPSSLNPGDNYTLSCDYGVISSYIFPVAGSGSCNFAGFTGTKANFNCTAGSNPGTFSNRCTIATGPSQPDYYCSHSDNINNLTVNPPSVVADINVANPDFGVPTYINGPITTFYADSVNLNWMTNAASCAVSGTNGDSWSPGPNNGGVPTSLLVNPSTTFSLNCTNGGSDTVQVKVPPVPNGLTSTCNAAGTNAHFTWNSPSGYNTFYIRVNQGTTWYWPSDVIEDGITGNQYDFTTTPGQEYTLWLHSREPSNGAWSQSVAETFTCNNDPVCSPVDGYWSSWSPCSGGVQTRSCNPPSCGGEDYCTGPSSQTCSTPTCDITVTKGGQGIVQSNPAGINCGTSCNSQTASFTCGIGVTLTATNPPNRIFTSWSGGCTGNNPICTLPNIVGGETVQANFSINPFFHEF